MSEWRTIDSAPKRGQPLAPRFGPTILLATTHGTRGLGYYDENGDGLSGREGWVCLETHRLFYSQDWTHWMPLPEPSKD